MQFCEFGFDFSEIFETSAAQNSGVKNLLAAAETKLVSRGFLENKKTPENSISIAFVGQPNAGKSSLVNVLTRSEKLIVSEIPGATRDAVDLEIQFDGKKFVLIDTAGIRRKKPRGKNLENLSILRSFAAIQKSDVVGLLIDATRGITRQDQNLAAEVCEQKRGLLFIVSKWDDRDGGKFVKAENLSDEKIDARAEFFQLLRRKFPFAPHSPVIFCSAEKKLGLTEIFNSTEKIAANFARRISTGILNQFLAEIYARGGIPSRAGKVPPRVKFATQISAAPPHFVFFGADENSISPAARRFLENRIRETFDFAGVPLILQFRRGKRDFLKNKK